MMSDEELARLCNEMEERYERTKDEDLRRELNLLEYSLED